MEMTMEMVVATRAEILARVIYPESAEVDAREVLEQAERLAQAVGSDRRRAIVWVRQILSHEAVTLPVLMALGFDRWFVDAADTVGMRHRESVQDYVKRVAACHDPDVIAVAVAAFDERIHAGVDEQKGTLAAYEEGRGVLERAADALARKQPGNRTPGDGLADDRPTAADRRKALMELIVHTNSAQDAMAELMQGGDDLYWELTRRERDLLVHDLHDLLQIVGVLVIGVTAKKNENTTADKKTLYEAETRGTNLTQAMETIARTIARRLLDLNEAAAGENPGGGTVH